MDSIIIALKLMGYGLAGTFLALILLYIFILIIRRVFKPESEEKPEENK